MRINANPSFSLKNKKENNKDILKNENDSIHKKLRDIYNSLYEDNFFLILITSKIVFLNTIDSKSREITEVLLKPNQNKHNSNILNKIRYDINKRYLEDYSILFQACKNIKSRIIHYNYLTNFRKHCERTDDYAFHSCTDGKFKKLYEIKIINHDNNKEGIKYVFCPDCKYCFLSNCIRMVCRNCNKEYFSSVIDDKQDKNILLATWEKYHCGSMKNQIMKCIKCKKNLYINLYNNQLMCLNKNCNFISKPQSILWKCSKCGKDFRSKAKVYNPTELQIIQKSINLALLIQKKAFPKELPCCHKNPEEMTFYHKEECNGVLYMGILLDREIIVCNKCHAMNFEEKFTWICPNCKAKFHLHQIVGIKPFKARKYVINREHSLLAKRNNKSNINIRYLKNELTSDYNSLNEKLDDDVFKSIQVNNASFLYKNNYKNINLNTNTNTNNNSEKEQYYYNETENKLLSENDRSCSNDKINLKYNRLDSISIEEENFKKEKDELTSENNSQNISFGRKKYDLNKGQKVRGRHYKTLLDILQKRRLKESKTKTGRHLTNNSEYSINDVNSNNNYDRSSTGATNKEVVVTYKTSRNKVYNSDSKWKIISEANEINLNEDENFVYQKKINIGNNRKDKSYIDNNYKINNNSHQENYKKDNDIYYNIKYDEEKIIPSIMPIKTKNSIVSTNSIAVDNDSMIRKRNINISNNNKKETNNSIRFNNSSANLIENRIYHYNKRNEKKYINLNNNINNNLDNKNEEQNYTDNNKLKNDKNKIIRSEYQKKLKNRKYQNIEINDIGPENNTPKISENSNKSSNFLIYQNSKNYFGKNALKHPLTTKGKDESKNSTDKPIKVSRIYHVRNINKYDGKKNIKDNNSNSDNKIKEKHDDINIEVKDEYTVKKNPKGKIKKSHEKYIMDSIIATPDKINEISKQCVIPTFKDNDYKYLRPIGEGAYGMIYLVENIRNNKQYALKKILCKNLKEILKHKNQLELIFSMNHENIMKIYNLQFKYLDLTTYSLYVIMERAIGDWSLDIRKRMITKKYYKESEIINILKQVVSALSYLEEKKIAHRDIKPQNILIFPGKIFKVADLGEAKIIDNISKEITLRGSELYMSPIVYQKHKLNKKEVIHNVFKSDVFSLGFSTLYAICLNLNVIEDIRELDSMKNIVNIIDKYFNKNLFSDKLYRLILKMIEIDENKRLNFKELDKELKKW